MSVPLSKVSAACVLATCVSGLHVGPGAEPRSGTGEPSLPTKPGCYVWLPSGCFKHAFHAKTFWRKIQDDDPSVCKGDIPRKYNSWCGTTDAKTTFVLNTPGRRAGELVTPAASNTHQLSADTTAWPVGFPTSPGCYVMMPSGCPAASHPNRQDLKGFAEGLNVSEWKLDQWGEANVKAGVSRVACEEQRKSQFDTWCGTTDAKMLFLPGSMPPQPSVPGCYIWMPTGCPKQKYHAKTMWRHTHSAVVAVRSGEECVTDAKKGYNSWCGREDAVSLWVPRAPKAPKEPGCYMWMPAGCRNHPSKVQQQWRRDDWGEQNAQAADDRTECEKRKAHFDTWCGIVDTRALFVPPQGTAPEQDVPATPAEGEEMKEDPVDERAISRRYG